MWPLPTIKNELVSFILNEDNLICAWIRQNKTQPRLTLQAYRHIALDTIGNEASITNPSVIVKQFKTFLHDYHLCNAFATLAVAPLHVIQNYITLAHATPKSTDFAPWINMQKQTSWEYEYLYPTDTNEYVFYLCGIKNSILLQYKLIALRLPLNLLTITTQDMALLHVYQNKYGNTFRKAQLAIDMVAHNNMPSTLFTHETIQRIMHIPSTVQIQATQENSFLLLAAGLHLAQGITQ
ncbi:MAG: hypothetical protein Q8Q25_00490 [bacterium]|nr:hypothetical protein [bacterium]